MAAAAEILIKVLTDSSQAQKGLDTTASKAGKMQKGIQKAAAPAALALAGIGAAAISAGRAAAEDAQSQAVLAKQLQNSTGATKDQVAAVEDHISKMSQATGVADDELRPAMGNLVRATGDVTKAQDAMGAALDISAATGADVESVSKALAKAYSGNTGALKKLVPGMDAAVLASGDMDAIMGELAKTTGGAAAASADTAAGRMQKMQVAMDEAQESIGTALLPAMSKFADILTKVAGFIQEHSTAVGIAVGVIGALAAAILIANAAISIYTTVTTLAGIASGIAWLAALWPILLVIAAIVAVVAVIVLLWKKCDWFRAAVLAVWAAIQSAFQAVVGWLRRAWDATVQAMATAVRWVRGVFSATWNAIRAAVAAVVASVRAVWQSVFGWLRSAVAAVRASFVAQFNAVRSAVGTIANAVKSVWRTVFDALSRSASAVASVIRRPFDAVRGAIDAVISGVRSLIDWLGRIRIPKLSLPKIPGLNATASVAAAAPAVTSGALRATPAATATRATASAGVTIVINGAIDPESTARQVRRILAAHDRRMGLSGAGLRAGTV